MVDLDHPLVQDGGADDVHEATHAYDIALLLAGKAAPLGLTRRSSLSLPSFSSLPSSSPASASLFSSTLSASPLTEERLSELFQAFAGGFHREYADEDSSNSDVRARAYEAFKDNARKVHANNVKEDGTPWAKFALNREHIWMHAHFHTRIINNNNDNNIALP
eukprot:jgi/Chlat1/1141/Chrsp112S01620